MGGPQTTREKERWTSPPAHAFLVVGLIAACSAPAAEISTPNARTTAAAPVPSPSGPAAADADADVDAGPGGNAAVAIPQCHRFCSLESERGCGHWQQHGARAAGSPTAPRFLDCDPACCDPATPSRLIAEQISLEELAYSVSEGTYSSVATRLGGHDLSLRCDLGRWRDLPEGMRVRTCPAGRIDLGTLTATLEVELTVPAQGRLTSDSLANLLLVPEGAADAWERAARSMLEATTVSTSDADVYALGGATAVLTPAHADVGVRLRLVP